MRIIPDQEPWSERVVGTIPADGWVALYHQGSKREKNLELWGVPVIAWVTLRDYDEDHHRENDEYDPGIWPLVIMREESTPTLGGDDESELLHLSQLAFRLSELFDEGYSTTPRFAATLRGLGVEVDGRFIHESEGG